MANDMMIGLAMTFGSGVAFLGLLLRGYKARWVEGSKRFMAAREAELASFPEREVRVKALTVRDLDEPSTRALCEETTLEALLFARWQECVRWRVGCRFIVEDEEGRQAIVCTKHARLFLAREEEAEVEPSDFSAHSADVDRTIRWHMAKCWRTRTQTLRKGMSIWICGQPRWYPRDAVMVGYRERREAPILLYEGTAEDELFIVEGRDAKAAAKLIARDGPAGNNFLLLLLFVVGGPILLAVLIVGVVVLICAPT